MLNKIEGMSVWAKLMGVFICVGVVSAITIVITGSIHAYVIAFMSVLLTYVSYHELVTENDYEEEEF